MKRVFKLFGAVVADAGDRWSNDDVAPSQFRNFLATLEEGDEIEIAINSPGGVITSGVAIANMIRDCGYKVIAKVHGMAASIAGVIAAACDEVIMWDESYFMVHNPWMITLGDMHEIRKDAELLDSMKSSCIGFYRKVFPELDEAEISSLMDDSTWISGAEADVFGLNVTNAGKSAPIAASIVGGISFADIPDAAKKFYTFDHTLALEQPEEGEGEGGETPPVEGEGQPPAEGGEGSEGEGQPASIIELTERLEQIEANRRDQQARADRLHHELETARAAAEERETELQTEIERQQNLIAEYEARIANMALNALQAPDRGCAQTWKEAIAECGGYEAAKAKYPHLAEAYRKGKGN